MGGPMSYDSQADRDGGLIGVVRECVTEDVTSSRKTNGVRWLPLVCQIESPTALNLSAAHSIS
jgi:hypothetical protein